jgi:hypothetical protein
MTKTQVLDLAERAGWTLAQAAVAFGITEASGLTAWWALPMATALSAAKTLVQSKLAKAPKGA